MRSNRAKSLTRHPAKGGGFALIELVLAVSFMAIAFAGISTSLASSLSLRESNVDRARAIRAALSLSDSLKDEDFATLFARYNTSDLDDPNGIGTAPGPFFEVDGLTSRSDDNDTFVGAISFPGDGFQLREDIHSRNLGMPRDLSADGLVDALDHALDYEVLPITITIEWVSARGSDSIVLSSTLTSR
ncbi:MAG: type II secretory pathway pseudopilin PulG [Planctomycetota bacterium]|jgi:type II secretory pathway pseudopilin PulG